ncbi:MAG: DUF6067 family protein [Cyclobacteriaceae bacterium]|jgi:hypothetical protein
MNIQPLGNFLKIAVGFGILLASGCYSGDRNLRFTVTDTPWEVGLGNHRAILDISKGGEAVMLDLLWRRRDRNPNDKKFIIINSITGDTVRNIHRINVDEERCNIVFGPVDQQGLYYFYYMPYVPDTTYGGYDYGYLEQEDPPDKKWLDSIKEDENGTLNHLPKAECLEIQARTEFDSFFPMEIIPTKKEYERFLKNNPSDYLLFPEDRKNPIRMKRDIPLKWIEDSIRNTFSGQAERNEYYAFQLGLFASKKELSNIKLEFSDLLSKNSRIPASGITCFNISGIDPDGKPFKKNLNIPEGQVQALWIGIDVPENINPGVFEGTARVIPENADPSEIKIKLEVSKKMLQDRGDSEPWRHSRLRWLNSTLGIDDEPVEPYSEVVYKSPATVKLTNKDINLGKDLFPESIQVFDKEILNRPISIRITSGKDLEIITETKKLNEITKPGKISIEGRGQSANLIVSTKGIIEFDGWMNYKVKIKAVKDISNIQVELDIPVRKDIAEYMMGMGLPGTMVPDHHQEKWQGPHDSFWLGNTEGGIHCELRGSTYHGPLLNLYKPEYPASWYNDGKGRLTVKKQRGEVLATASSGKRPLTKDEEIEFEFSLLITPVKEVNPKAQFTDRFYHSGSQPTPGHEDVETGIRVINVHHGNKFIPYINYPFLDTDSLSAFIDHWHSKGIKVKIYYTIRELTNHLPELWALRSLGYEILQNGPGGGFPWLREHLRSNYRSQWYHPYDDGGADAALLTSAGDTRWINYYIEGLDWLVKNLDIDGLYLDDVAFDRRTLKRMRKVLNRSKNGAMIDLHSNTGFSKGPAIQYTEFFPYVDKLWFGESFQYNDMPADNWLVEVSGIPFGLMGDMLQGGGNRWLGMLFGMTVRLPWYTAEVMSDPRPVWRFWDEYNIAESRMIGFWDAACPIQTDDSEVKVTIYDHQDHLIIALGNFSRLTKDVLLSNRPGSRLDITGKQLIAPNIQDFQDSAVFSPGEKIKLDPKKGWLLILEK